MACVDPVIDGVQEGRNYKCDKCGSLYVMTDEEYESETYCAPQKYYSAIMAKHGFERRNPPDCLKLDFCKKCQPGVVRLAPLFADIMATMALNHRLKRAIDENRN